MIIKKSIIGMIVLVFTSLILTAGSPFQIANNLVENNGNLSIKNFGLQVYAADDDDDEDIEEYNKKADEQHDED